MSMFTGTYVSEQLLSLMNLNRSRYRSQLKNAYLNSTLKDATAHCLVPDINTLVTAKRSQVSSSRSAQDSIWKMQGLTICVTRNRFPSKNLRLIPCLFQLWRNIIWVTVLLINIKWKCRWYHYLQKCLAAKIGSGKYGPQHQMSLTLSKQCTKPLANSHWLRHSPSQTVSIFSPYFD